VLDWDRFVADRGPPTLRLACRILGPGPDAEDVVQEAFLQVYLIGQNEKVTSWGGLLHRAVLHRSLDRLRRRRPSGPLADEPPSREDDPQETAAARELAHTLRQAIGRLPPQQADAFCMRYFDDQPYEQIAKNLGVAVGAVASALHKARGKLKSMLAVSLKED
jgi:RNA polymerase sigma-70 factor (ECF subfamily)